MQWTFRYCYTVLRAYFRAGIALFVVLPAYRLLSVLAPALMEQTETFGQKEKVKEGSRFNFSHRVGKLYSFVLSLF